MIRFRKLIHRPRFDKLGKCFMLSIHLGTEAQKTEAIDAYENLCELAKLQYSLEE